MEQGKTMANIEVRLSTGSITSTNVDSPNNSIGGKMAQTASGTAVAVITESSFGLNTIWDNLTQLDNVGGNPDYRCLYIYNNPNGSKRGPMLGTKLYISGSTYSAFQVAKLDEKNREATLARDEKEAPLGVAFEDHKKGAPLVIGTLEPGDYQAVWFKRTPVNISGAGEIRESFEFIIVGSD